MKAIQGYHLIRPEDLQWRPSNLMKIPNADYLERTGSENLGARLWRLPPKSANTLHKHIRSEEFYFVLEGIGRMRVGDETLTVPKYGGVLVAPEHGVLATLRNGLSTSFAGLMWSLQLIVIGLIAHTCIESTVRYGAELGYDVTVVRDATADYSDEMMHAALDINMPNYASAIVTTKDVVESIFSLQVSNVMGGSPAR